VLGGLFALACDRESPIVLTPAWPSDQPAVLVPVDPSLHPLEDTPIWMAAGQASATFKLTRDERFLVYALVYSSSVSDNFDRCGVTFSGSGVLPGLTPDVVWTTPPEVASPGLSLTLTTTAIKPPFESQIHYANADPSCAAPPPTKCEDILKKIQVRATPLPAAGGYNLFSVSRVSPSAALGGSANDGPPGDDGAVYRVTADGQATAIPIAGQRGSAFQVAYDGKRTVFGLSTQGTYFQLDPTGGLGFAVSAPFANASARLHSGRDGFTVSNDPTSAYQLTPGSTVGRSRPDFPLSGDLFVVTATRVAAVSNGGIWYYDGRSWVEEYRGPEAELPPITIYSTRGLAGNAQTFVFAYNIPTGSGVLIRDEATHQWTQLAASPFHLPIDAVAVLGRGNVLLLGQSGDAAIWLASQGAPWCSIATGTNEDFLAIDVSPDELSAVAVQGETTADLGPRLISFSLPSID
jgi:hypothetical protein